MIYGKRKPVKIKKDLQKIIENEITKIGVTEAKKILKKDYSWIIAVVDGNPTLNSIEYALNKLEIDVSVTSL